jgi:LuxR family transcriptional regulator, maltose regulon positive regulatory protein
MSVAILATKLYIPLPRPKIVLRPRLIDRLNDGLHHKLTIISAPAGFGKTTLISAWVTSFQDLEPKVGVAWLTLDEGDKDLTRFLAYLVAALQTIAPNIGASVIGVLQSPQPPPAESILTALVNEITAIPDNFVLVLDDYHMLDAGSGEGSASFDEALTFLLEHQPPNMHLVITTREDPRLPLARLRGRGQLTELRVNDLRFSLSEAAEFLNQVMGLNLSEADIAALETRTEGWIAGLQLAAISMQGQTDAVGFIQSFTGSHRFVLDYLVEEVLQKQSKGIQAFLLCTSILDRLCGPLCDAILQDVAVPGQETAGQKTLEYLERANLFLMPLDNERRWYRYHPLFAELLRMRLARIYPDHVAELHLRASDWFANNDFPYEAVTHALTVQDWTRAAEVIERFSDELPMLGDSNTRLGWFESFPTQILMDRPRLALTYAWALFMSNQLDRAEQQLNQLMPLVQTVPSLLGELYVIRVMIAIRRNNMTAFFELAQQALSRVTPEEASPRSRILLTLGVAYDEMSGDIASAKNAFREAYVLGKASSSPSSVGNAPLPLTALAYLADYEWLEGNLRSASRMYEQAIEFSEKWGGQSSIALCLVQQGRAGLLYEWNDLDGTARALQECIHIGEVWKGLRFLAPAYGLSALVMQARGRAEEADAMIRRAEQATHNSDWPPYDMGLLALYQIALRIARNDFHAIEQWEEDHDSVWRSRAGRARDALIIVLARAQIARFYQTRDGSALRQARGLIEPALEGAQVSGLMFNFVRLLILDALTLYAQGDTSSAISTLKRALALAEPENYVRSFLDIGKPMEEFLLWSLESPTLSDPHLRTYVSKLLSHFGADIQMKSSQMTGEGLIEPLSDRELEVLRLIAQGLSNREIGERLFLSLNTVKGHNQKIFDKLQVQRRTEAVERARQLDLL